jgi:hypothetical protein
VASTEITVTGGQSFHVDGASADVEARIVAGARGSIMEMVWFTDAATGQPVAINPEHVVALRPSETSP